MILDTEKDLKKCRKFLELFNNYDIYFDPSFLNIHKNSYKNIVYIYKEDENIFYLPLQIFKIKINENYFDFETVNGYSGPLSTSKNKVFLENAWSNLLKELKFQKIIAGIIRFHPFIKNHKFAEHCEDVKIIKMRKVVYLEKFYKTNYINNYSKGAKRKINKVKNEDFVFKKDVSIDNIKIFADL